MGKIKAFFFGAAFVVVSYTASADPWVDNWLSSYTFTGGGHYAGAQRGYLTAGGFQARWNTGTDYLFTAQPPRLRVGCGGIDMFLGGLSYLDFDMLGQKLQRVLTAAPAVALDLAIKQYCEQCSDTMKDIEAVARFLNGMQLNECALAKRVVATVQEDDPDILGAVWAEVSQGQSLREGLSRNAHEHQDQVRTSGGAPPNDLSNIMDSCPAPFRDIFVNPSEPSVVANIAEKTGLLPFEDVIRGFMGDVTVRYDAPTNTWNVNTIPPCPNSDVTDFTPFLMGEAEERPADGTACSINSSTGLLSHVETQLGAIYDRMDANQVFSVDEEAFLDSTPLPVLMMMKTAKLTSTRDATVATYAEAVGSGYAYRVLDDFHRAMRFINGTGANVWRTTVGVAPGGDIDTCQPNMIKQARVLVTEMSDRVDDGRVNARSLYFGRVGELKDSLSVAADVHERYKRANNEVNKDLR
ncbi:MAG: conjugal transfer protein TraH [Pseudomonadales bacterium]